MFLTFEIIMFNSKFRIKSYLSLSNDFFFFLVMEHFVILS